MGNQRILDRPAQEVFFAERRVNAARPQVECLRPAPRPAQALELDVEFAELEVGRAGFALKQLQLRKEIDVLPDRRLDRDRGVIHPEFRIGPLAVAAGRKNSQARLAADAHRVVMRRFHRDRPLRRCDSIGPFLQRLQLAVLSLTRPADHLHLSVERLNHFLLRLHLLLQLTVLLHDRLEGRVRSHLGAGQCNRQRQASADTENPQKFTCGMHQGKQPRQSARPAFAGKHPAAATGAVIAYPPASNRRNSASLITDTPSSFALSSFEPASSPAST